MTRREGAAGREGDVEGEQDEMRNPTEQIDIRLVV